MKTSTAGSLRKIKPLFWLLDYIAFHLISMVITGVISSMIYIMECGINDSMFRIIIEHLTLGVYFYYAVLTMSIAYPGLFITYQVVSSEWSINKRLYYTFIIPLLGWFLFLIPFGGVSLFFDFRYGAFQFLPACFITPVIWLRIRFRLAKICL